MYVCMYVCMYVPGGMVAGQIEPCVKRKTGIVQLIIVLSFFLCRL